MLQHAVKRTKRSRTEKQRDRDRYKYSCPLLCQRRSPTESESESCSELAHNIGAGLGRHSNTSGTCLDHEKHISNEPLRHRRDARSASTSRGYCGGAIRYRRARTAGLPKRQCRFCGLSDRRFCPRRRVRKDIDFRWNRSPGCGNATYCLSCFNSFCVIFWDGSAGRQGTIGGRGSKCPPQWSPLTAALHFQPTYADS